MRYFSICVVTCIAILICSSNPSYAKDVTLAWDANTEADLAGYKIYYEPGASGGQNLASYPGTGAAEGSSPIGMQPTADETLNPESCNSVSTDWTKPQHIALLLRHVMPRIWKVQALARCLSLEVEMSLLPTTQDGASQLAT